MPAQAPVRDRTIGIVYLLYFSATILSLVFSKGLFVPDNAAATAQNILLHESSFRANFALNLVATAFYVALTALFYCLFEPVHKGFSLIAAFFSLMGCAIQTCGSLFQLASLVVLHSSMPETPLFNAAQLQAFSLIFLKLNTQAFDVGLVFFALYCLSIGYLVLRSTFLPRFLGVLMIAAGLGWLMFLDPPFAAHLSPFIQIVGAVAELALMLWLLMVGVDAKQWEEMDQ